MLVLTFIQVLTGEPQHIVFTIPIFEPLPSQYYIKAVSDRWLGAEAVCIINFQNLILPERHPPHTGTHTHTHTGTVFILAAKVKQQLCFCPCLCGCLSVVLAKWLINLWTDFNESLMGKIIGFAYTTDYF